MTACLATGTLGLLIGFLLGVAVASVAIYLFVTSQEHD